MRSPTCFNNSPFPFVWYMSMPKAREDLRTWIKNAKSANLENVEGKEKAKASRRNGDEVIIFWRSCRRRWWGWWKPLGDNNVYFRFKSEPHHPSPQRRGREVVLLVETCFVPLLCPGARQIKAASLRGSLICDLFNLHFPFFLLFSFLSTSSSPRSFNGSQHWFEGFFFPKQARSFAFSH